MLEVLNTLFLTTEGSYLHVDHDAFKIEIPDTSPVFLPRLNIGSIVVIGNVMVSPQAMGRCAREGRTISFLDFNGRFLARVEGETSGNVLLRIAQHEVLNDEPRRLAIGKAIIAGKIKNCRALLIRNARNASAENAPHIRKKAELLGKILPRVAAASEREKLLGIEGHAAAEYFDIFSRLIHGNTEDWHFHGRNRRPPLDPVNAVLSFLYIMLTHDVRSALEGVGLDPQVGFLHGLRPGRPALALDLMEELRPLFVDRLVFRLINRRQIRPKDFMKRSGGAVQIKDDSRKTILSAYQEYKREDVQHPLVKQKIARGVVPHIQARLLARVIRKETENYLPFTVSE